MITCSIYEKVDQLLTEYLYQEFLECFSRKFMFMKKDEGRIKHARYTWDDPSYKNFMSKILSNLEPIQYQKEELIMDELDEVNQVIFILRDAYHVGFYINKGVQYKLKLKQFSIGDYFITFNMKSQYAYKAACQCSGYFIRRKNWYAILNDPDH
jgi:hypothetical protein